MNFSLSMAFTNQQLDVIASTNTKVIVAKPTAGGAPNVAWQAFDPLTANTLSWEEQYGIYVSTASVTGGAKLEKLSSTGIPAASNKLYTLTGSGVISNPDTGGEAGSFSLLNSYNKQDLMTVGLYQDATVNGTAIAGNAISAAGVMLASTAVMTPYTTLYVWLHSEIESNTVVTKVNSPMSILKFGGAVTTISTAYDTESGMFLPN
ncbi:hypothetical protein [Cellvibrio sp.]|jgi:hypothetical protein